MKWYSNLKILLLALITLSVLSRAFAGDSALLKLPQDLSEAMRILYQGDKLTGMKQMQAAIYKHSGCDPKEKALRAYATFLLADAYFKLNRFDTAIPFFKQVMKHEEDFGSFATEQDGVLRPLLPLIAQDCLSECYIAKDKTKKSQKILKDLKKKLEAEIQTLDAKTSAGVALSPEETRLSYHLATGLKEITWKIENPGKRAADMPRSQRSGCGGGEVAQAQGGGCGSHPSSSSAGGCGGTIAPAQTAEGGCGGGAASASPGGGCGSAGVTTQENGESSSDNHKMAEGAGRGSPSAIKAVSAEYSASVASPASCGCGGGGAAPAVGGCGGGAEGQSAGGGCGSPAKASSQGGCGGGNDAASSGRCGSVAAEDAKASEANKPEPSK